MEQGIHQRKSGRVKTWQLLLVLLAVFASGAQQLVAQTHWHASAVAGSVSGSPDGDAGNHDDCLLCQIAAHASAAAPPAASLQFNAATLPIVHVATTPQGVAIARPAHAWQSRGPPTV